MALAGACHILISSGNSFVFVKANTDGGGLTLADANERDLDTSDKEWEIITSAGGYFIKNKMHSSHAIWKWEAKESDKVGLSPRSATALWSILPVDSLKPFYKIAAVINGVVPQLRWGVDDFKPGTPIVLSGKNNCAFWIRPIDKMVQSHYHAVRSSSDPEARQAVTTSESIPTGRMARDRAGPSSDPEAPQAVTTSKSTPTGRMAQDPAGRSSSDPETPQAVTTSESFNVVPTKKPGNTKENASLCVRKAYNFRVLGNPKGALSAQEEAVQCYRELLKTDPTFKEDLAMSLLKLGFDFSEASRHQDAVFAHKESIGLFKSLAKPDASLQARALQSVAVSFRAAGLHEDASRAHEEGAAMFHELAKTDPGHIADTLHCLAADFRIFGFREDAARAEEKAIKLYCELAASTTGSNSLMECLLELLANGQGSGPVHASRVASH